MLSQAAAVGTPLRPPMMAARHAVALGYLFRTSQPSMLKRHEEITCSDKLMANAAYANNVLRFLGILLQLGAQAADININDVAATLGLIPDLVEQLIALHHLPGVRHKHAQDANLCKGECDS